MSTQKSTTPAGAKKVSSIKKLIDAPIIPAAAANAPSNPTTKPPAVYHHKVKNKPQGFQCQDANAVRARSKETYQASPMLAKFVSALWYEKNPEKRRECVRQCRQRNLEMTLERERASWKRNRTPEKLARMREYSRAYRLGKKRFKGVPSQTCIPQCTDHNREQ